MEKDKKVKEEYKSIQKIETIKKPKKQTLKKGPMHDDASIMSPRAKLSVEIFSPCKTREEENTKSILINEKQKKDKKLNNVSFQVSSNNNLNDSITSPKFNLSEKKPRNNIDLSYNSDVPVKVEEKRQLSSNICISSPIMKKTSNIKSPMINKSDLNMGIYPPVKQLFEISDSNKPQTISSFSVVSPKKTERYVSQLSQNNSLGCFEKNSPLKIIGIREKEKNKKELECLITWKLSGKQKVIDSVKDGTDVRDKCPQLLLDFYEERLKFQFN